MSWLCPHCRERVEDNFDICWNCGTAQDGTVDPGFVRAEPVSVEDHGDPFTPSAASAKPAPAYANRRCPDCDAEMTRIKLIDRQGQHGDTELHYTDIDAQRSWLPLISFGSYPADGVVEGVICSQCHRILLYGRPNEQ